MEGRANRVQLKCRDERCMEVPESILAVWIPPPGGAIDLDSLDLWAHGDAEGLGA